MNWKLEVKIINAGFIAALLILLSLSFFSYHFFQNSTEDAKWVAHTHTVLETSKDLLSNLKDAETGMRGYVITGNEKFLEPYTVSVAQNSALLSRMKNLVDDNPKQLERYIEAEGLIKRKFEFTREAVTIRKNSGFEAGVKTVITSEGQDVMDSLRLLFKEIENEEQRLLEKRINDNQQTVNTTKLLLLLGTITSVLIFLSIYFSLKRQIKRSRKQEEDLFIQNEWFTQTLTSLGDGVITTDINGIITLTNKACCEISGWKAEEAVGKHIESVFKITNETTGYIVANPALEALKKNEIVLLANHTLLERKDGTFTFIDDSGAPIRNKAGETIGAVLIFRDVSQRKKAERERNMFFTISTDMIGVAGTDGYFKRINPSFEKTLGYSEKEFLSKPFMEFVHPDDIRTTMLEMEKLSMGITTLNFINRYRCKDGTYKWLEWNTNPVGNLLYAVARDITERKNAEAEIEFINKELESFSYSVSHDLRSPLRAINGYTNILKKGYSDKIDAEGQELIDSTISNVKKMDSLINDLLTFSHLGKQNLIKTVIDMDSLVNAVVAELKAQLHSNAAQITVKPLSDIKGDSGLLKQVLTNLISNALKYSGKKEVPIVEIACYKDGTETVYYVKDNGVGFDMKYYDKLFGIFQRLHGTGEFEGTGIGLSIVERIIKKHNGKVWAEGKVDEGAVFYFSLPNE
ncbi:MAG: CHASE3 domain-containing protein [Bacteroidota bacterium]